MDSFVRCPGCGVELTDRHLPVADPYHASGECWELYGALTADNLGRPDATFVHQLCVDAYAAQHVGNRTKPITTVFALGRPVSGRRVPVHGKTGVERPYPTCEEDRKAHRLAAP
ncbi:MAG TPA: DUF5946 family protein [Bacillota bacterium]